MSGRVRQQAEKLGDASKRSTGERYDSVNGAPSSVTRDQRYDDAAKEAATTMPKPPPATPPFKNLKGG